MSGMYDNVVGRLDQELEDEQNARAELAWSIDPRQASPMVELAAKRQLPPGHVAFLGKAALPPFRPE